MLVERNNKLVGGVEVLPSEAGRVSLGKVLGRQGEEGNLTLLSVTGTMLNTALMAGGLVDRIHLFVLRTIWALTLCQPSKASPTPSTWPKSRSSVTE